ncbi:MAG: hypothetical protein RMM53_08155 [Bacteroidia bacterium]|nr:hypothetical protein [Bacteroidia bacterium]MDW8334170.1 hypothetical protein [Bacteroidia bacterium]
MNMNYALDKAYETKTFKELLDAPIDALQGLTKEHAQILKEKFRIKTIGDMARYKFFRIAMAIAIAAEFEQ